MNITHPCTQKHNVKCELLFWKSCVHVSSFKFLPLGLYLLSNIQNWIHDKSRHYYYQQNDLIGQCFYASMHIGAVISVHKLGGRGGDPKAHATDGVGNVRGEDVTLWKGGFREPSSPKNLFVAFISGVFIECVGHNLYISWFKSDKNQVMCQKYFVLTCTCNSQYCCQCYGTWVLSYFIINII
jgi:hypothetical protein